MVKFGKIVLKGIRDREVASRGDIFRRVQGEIKVPLTGLKEIKVGLLAFTEREEDVDKLLTGKAGKILEELGLETSVPPKVRAQRSIICRQVDSYVGGSSDRDLKVEIEKSNNVRVVEVIKFRDYTHVFKVELETTEMAARLKMRGVLAFNVKISPDQIETETYIDVQICFNCYKLDDHPTARCPEARKTVCSECSGAHSFRECPPDAPKRCLNCGGAHRTMAMSCPQKKEIIKRKREEEKREEKEKRPWAKIVEGVAAATVEKKEDHTRKMLEGGGFRAMVMVMDAHAHNMIEPGSYERRLNEVLKMNGVEGIKFPKTSNSDRLVGKAGEGAKEGKTRKKRVRSEEERMEEVIVEDTVEETDEETILDRHLRREESGVMDCDAAGIDMVTTAEIGSNGMKAEVLREECQRGRVKFRIRPTSKWKKEQVDKLLENKRLSLKPFGAVVVSRNVFEKIKNGVAEAPSKKPKK